MRPTATGADQNLANRSVRSSSFLRVLVGLSHQIVPFQGVRTSAKAASKNHSERPLGLKRLGTAPVGFCRADAQGLMSSLFMKRY